MAERTGVERTGMSETHIGDIVTELLSRRFSRETASETYGFLDTKEQLGKHVILLGLGGSYSYGTNREDSDIDIRGVSLNRKSDLIGLTENEAARHTKLPDEPDLTKIQRYVMVVNEGVVRNEI